MSDPSTRIRTARPADARAICEIWNPVIAGTCHTFTSELKTAPALAGVLEARAACWLVFCRGEQVHGFASFAQFRPGPGYAHTAEHSIYLHPEVTGTGAGRLLLGALETRAQAQGMRSFIAAISATNAPARAFHSAMGYAECGTLAGAGYKFGRWLDLVLMQKQLASAD